MAKKGFISPATFPHRGPSRPRTRVHERGKRGGLMALVLNIGKCTLLGNYRENNEDAIDVKQFPELSVCMVADGMGGQQAGEIAGKQGVDIIPRELKANLAHTVDQDESKRMIRRAIVQANAVIMEMAALDREYNNMGT